MPTTRLKTTGTIIDKLKRQKHARLSQIQDIAGARITVDGSRVAQDNIVELLQNRWQDAKMVDRRHAPTHGYRAVHLVVYVDGCNVEVQVRTELQDLWAQVLERVADAVGRGIRYGELPEGYSEQPGLLLARLIELSDTIDLYEGAEEMVMLDETIPDEVRDRLRDLSRAHVQRFRDQIEGLRRTFEEILRDPAG